MIDQFDLLNLVIYDKIKFRDDVRHVTRQFLTHELGIESEDLIVNILTKVVNLPWREKTYSKKREFYCLYVPLSRPFIPELALEKVRKIKVIGPHTEIVHDGVVRLVPSNHLAEFNTEKEKKEALKKVKEFVLLEERANKKKYRSPKNEKQELLEQALIDKWKAKLEGKRNEVGPKKIQ